MRPGEVVRHGLVGPALTAMMGQWWGELLLAVRAHVAERRGP